MKNKTIEIVDALHHKELIVDKFKVRNIIKSENEHKKKMKTEKKSTTSKIPAWFLAFEKRINARFDKIETEVKQLREDTNKRFEKIEDILKRNNLK